MLHPSRRFREFRNDPRHHDLARIRVVKAQEIIARLELRIFEDIGNGIDRTTRHLPVVALLQDLGLGVAAREIGYQPSTVWRFAMRCAVVSYISDPASSGFPITVQGVRTSCRMYKRSRPICCHPSENAHAGTRVWYPYPLALPDRALLRIGWYQFVEKPKNRLIKCHIDHLAFAGRIAAFQRQEDAKRAVKS